MTEQTKRKLNLMELRIEQNERRIDLDGKWTNGELAHLNGELAHLRSRIRAIEAFLKAEFVHVEETRWDALRGVVKEVRDELRRIPR